MISSSTRDLQATLRVASTTLKLQGSTSVSWQMFGAQAYVSLHFIGQCRFAMFASYSFCRLQCLLTDVFDSKLCRALGLYKTVMEGFEFAQRFSV